MTSEPISTQQFLAGLTPEKRELLRLLLSGSAEQTPALKRYPREDGDSAIALPCSWAQERLWFMDQLDGAGVAYNIPMAVTLHGNLDLAALQAALDHLLRRHEALRTTFISPDGEPLQQIASTARFALQVKELRSLSHTERPKQMLGEEADEAHQKFDLRTGPLIRGRLLRVQDTEHVLLITMHHVISDGWSIGVFVRELTQLYESYLYGRADSLPPLPVQYADYAQWQREWLRGEALGRQLRYWQARLDGATPQLGLPSDRPRPATRSYRGDNLEITLDAQLTTLLKSCARRHGMTLFMLIYAGWSILLARLSAQEDIVTGSPVANRQMPEIEGLIGFFVNTLVLRVQVLRDAPVHQFLEQVKEVTLGAYSYQDAPFEQIVEILHPQRALNHNPLFQVMLVLQNSPQSELRLPGLTGRLRLGVTASSKFDLLLSLEESGAQIVGNLNYCSELFDRTTVERWMASLGVVLQAIVAASPETRVGDLPILPEPQSQQILKSFNETQTPYPDHSLVQELFERQVRRAAQAIAVIHHDDNLTYEQLNQRANQLARYLCSLGIRRDTPVGICMERGLPMLTALLAVLKAGGAYVPLDPHYPFERLEQMLADAQPEVVLTQMDLRSLLPSTQATLVAVDKLIDRQISHLPREDLRASTLGLTPHNLVYVIYTSGSTGRPKGTCMTHISMVNLIEWHRRTFGERIGTRVLQFAPVSFDVAFQEVFSTLCTGGTLVLLDEWIRKDAQALTMLLKRTAIERLFIPPLMLQILAEYAETTGEKPASLHDVITAGEQLRVGPGIVRFFCNLPGARLHNHYGPTETHVVTALTLTGSPESWPSLPTIGRPIANTMIFILDEAGHPTPIGVPGEVYIGGVGVARGYLRRPELTAQRFIRNPFDVHPDARLYKTGDLGRWCADGTIEYLGRNDHQVKIRGYRIELSEIEIQLARHAKVKEAAVIVHETPPGEKTLVAFVTSRYEHAPTESELRAHLRQLLPEFMVPSAFVTLEKLPISPNGKLDRRALPVPNRHAYAAETHEPPMGDIEETLARIWQELLHVTRIGRQSNFFELGGHSLHIMKLTLLVRTRFRVALAVPDVFRYPRLQELAIHVASLRPEEGRQPDRSEMKFEEGVI